MKTTLFILWMFLSGMLASACGSNASQQTVADSLASSSIDSVEALVDSQSAGNSFEALVDSQSAGKSLNDIRFGDWTEAEQWFNNAYVDELRAQLDKMAKEGDKTIPFAKNRFVILQCEPFLTGGLFLTIVFEHHLDRIYNAWVYGVVDEETETVIDYELRSISEDEEYCEMITVTEEGLLDYMKNCPFVKWK